MGRGGHPTDGRWSCWAATPESPPPQPSLLPPSLQALQKSEPCSPLPGRRPDPRQRLGSGSTAGLGVRAAVVIVQALGMA